MGVSMNVSSFVRARAIRSLAVPLVLAIPPLFWVAEATRRASLTPLGRDQGIFQYVAWAIMRGARDYRDVRDVNGPLTHMVHIVLLALGGSDEHRFRVIDLAITGLTFALVGACVPGLRRGARPDLVDRTAWALAGWVILSGQHLLYGYWDLAQRESFFDWFILPAVALQLVAQDPRGSVRSVRWQLAAAGALSVLTWFGKPTYAFLTAVQFATLLLDRDQPLSRGRAAAAFAAGGCAGAAVPLAFLLRYGDIAAFARIQFVDVPAMYRFIWPRAAADILSKPWNATQAIFAVLGASGFLALIALGALPTRTSTVALMPLAALAGVLVQAKGFPYHFHPVTAGVHAQWLVFACWAAERARVARRRLALVRVVPVAVALVVAFRIATAMEDSPHVRATWLLWGAATAEERASREYFARFPEPDFFPYEMRQAAAYLRGHTSPDDRVQVYGMDPYILFLAQRASATPFLYAYDLDADAALTGGTGGRPDDAQAAVIRAMRDQHEAEMLRELEARPPAALVFLDAAPLLSESDAWDDFQEHCAETAAWVHPRYRESARFGHDHVWLRLDLAGPAASPPTVEPSEPSDDSP